MTLSINLAGEEVSLSAQRALYSPRTSTLLIADAHFGKAATFRASGIFVPRGTTSRALEHLSAAIEQTTATRIVFLGDLLHAKEGRSSETLRVVGEWRAAHESVEMILVRGNHDRSAGDPPGSLGIACVDAPLLQPPFAFAHHPRPVDGYHVLAGHMHPAVRLSGAGRQHERLPCFWVREHVTVLPAFGDFTGSADVEPAEGDRLYAIADNSVVELVSR